MIYKNGIALRIEYRYVKGHIEVYINDEFCTSGDTMAEVQEDIDGFYIAA